MAWNKHAAALHARQSAGISSQKRCGEFTRKAIRAGGADIGNAPNAKNYGREKIRQVTWYSDFRQRDMWGGPGYRSARPAYKIYRKS